MTPDELWGALFLALGCWQAFKLFQALDSGRWTSLAAGWQGAEGAREPVLNVSRRAHPIGFWFCLAWTAFCMTVLVFLGAYDVAPLILSILGR